MCDDTYSYHAELFGDCEMQEEADSSSSSSSEEEDMISDNESSSLAESDEWTATGVLPDLQFANIGHFNIGPAECPIDYFELLFNSTFMSLLVSSINAHALRIMLESTAPNNRSLNWKDTNIDEIRVFIALVFHMGHIRLNCINDYWNTDVLYSLPFKNYMSRDRFLSILRSLYFSDANSYSNVDPTRFVKPIISFFNDLMKSLVYPSKDLTIDESLFFWQGRLKNRQHIKGKRHKHGNKMYVLTDTNGITQKIHMYCRSHDVDLQGSGHADKVVMLLMQDYLNAGHSLYMDSFYNSVTLAEKLLVKNTYVTGTLRANRRRNPSITKSKIAKGTFLTRYNSRGVCVTNYRDKRNVLMISTEHHSDFVEHRNRHGLVSQKPKVIIEYKKVMKGVYRKVQMLSYYPSFNKSTRWYKKIIVHVMQVMLMNCFIMFNEQMKLSGNNDKVLSFLEFRLNIVKKLLKVETSTDELTNDLSVPSTTSSTNKIKTNNGDDIHLPVECSKSELNGKVKRKNCKQCAKLKIRKATSYYCPLCSSNPGLCLTCFRDYHGY